ncbi:carbohydrate ABC transporter permease [Lachnotalea sp. AF33-28]|jgi:putative aldouronate transport system permease protein|uniref:carbohydrate ABC transporter permease n=1 Tax=Lachnotalea sp. AF33-28 TaxID=2292046 RepID=UPI000E4D118F|nr:carbohydrate ABC transporter permease [Lachnotalea sp. AF33-28]RHP36239.1 carbohydrate ABC transporter permease [Lachnotalea sp. AF33-28]
MNRRNHSDTIFDTANVIIMCVLLLIFIWPLWFVVAASFSDPNELWMGNVVLLPKGFTLEAYEKLLEYSDIWVGYKNSILYTAAGTLVNLAATVALAYPLSRKDFMPRNLIMMMLIVTMYFSGGLIPTYLVVKNLGMVNTFWAMIIPGAISTYNVIVTRTYFSNSIPAELHNAAKIDGANNLQFLWKIVLPLSKPILAVIGLYYAVGHWNDYYTALIYLYDKKLFPLTCFLKNMIIDASLSMEGSFGVSATEMEKMIRLSQSLKYSTIIISVIPLLIIYPFIQKFFVKGVMIGSIKG